MEPRFECAFCGRQVSRRTDEHSVGMDGSIYFSSIDKTLDIAREFCCLDCLISYIHVWYARKRTEEYND